MKPAARHYGLHTGVDNQNVFTPPTAGNPSIVPDEKMNNEEYPTKRDEYEDGV